MGGPNPGARARRLRELAEGQDAFLEALAARATTRNVQVGDGYALVQGDLLFETNLAEPASNEAAVRLLATVGATRVLAMSFDRPLMAIGRRSGGVGRHAADLFRRFDTDQERTNPGVVIAAGADDDLPEITEMEDGLFTSREAARLLLRTGQLLTFRWKGELAGYGTLQQVVECRPEIDICMAVARPYRGRGLGAFIVNHLARLCLARSTLPTASCAAANLTSRAALRAGGLRADHHLIAFRLGPPET